MSLIVARKEGNQIAIVSDTKLTYPHHEIKGLKTPPGDGIIKTIIINSNLCISFANVVSYAQNALKEIPSESNFEQAIGILKEHHYNSNRQTEFIICSGKPNPIIYEIKSTNVGEVQSSWIGSLDAFDLFQECMQGVRKSNPESQPNNLNDSKANVVLSMDMTAETDMQVKIFSKMSSAIDEVIQTSNIDSVGGFKINVVFDECFKYTKYVKFYRHNVELHGDGAHILGHGTAGEGAYSVNFLGSSTDFKTVALHVKQAHLGISYVRQDNGLLYPQLFDLDEVDFVDFVKDHYNLIAAISTEDRTHKFVRDAKVFADNGKFEKAIDLLNKALSSANGVKRAEVLFYKGICLLNIKQDEAASRDFVEAVNLDSSFQEKIIKILSQKK